MKRLDDGFQLIKFVILLANVNRKKKEKMTGEHGLAASYLAKVR